MAWVSRGRTCITWSRSMASHISSGGSIRERALALIEVAHPRWREMLLSSAKKLGYVRSEQYLASQVAYPVHEERVVSLKNDQKIMIRPARAGDAGALQALFHRLSPDDV
jgi:hypothetical protein